MFCQECAARKYWLDRLDPTIILEGKGDPMCPEHAAARDVRAIGRAMKPEILKALTPIKGESMSDNPDKDSGSVYVFPEPTSPIDDYYVGQTIICEDGEYHIIKAYDGKTRQATIHGEWSEKPS